MEEVDMEVEVEVDLAVDMEEEGLVGVDIMAAEVRHSSLVARHNLLAVRYQVPHDSVASTSHIRSCSSLCSGGGGGGNPFPSPHCQLASE